MKITDRARVEELEAYLEKHPETTIIETLLVDMNGILRGKRIGRHEFRTLYEEGLKVCGATALLDSRGEIATDIGVGTRDGDPDVMIYAVAGTLVPSPWLGARVAQVFTSLAKFDGSANYSDSRYVLRRTCEKLRESGLHPVVATELEFYLLEAGSGTVPGPRLGNIPGTRLKQQGWQYSSMEELWENDPLLMDVLESCELQAIPATTVLSEFSPGQFEINLHHVKDPLTACDQGAMLKRVIKGTTFKHGLGASFMAKPFAEFAGNGLHIHTSLYDDDGNNVFADTTSSAVPAISDTMRHAIGGLQRSMADGMAIFAPNANSYRRLLPMSYVPLSPSWGYNHRSVALRIPVCDADNMRVEHRVAGADANPYLVMSAVLAGIHYGITNQCEPTEMIVEGTMMDREEVSLPIRWEAALDKFRNSEILPVYLGEEFCRVFELVRRSECDRFHAQISNLDYDWYLRSV